jgi:hypothetical protein
LAPGTTTLVPAAVAPSINPGVLSSGRFSQGLRAGETLTVTGTGVLDFGFTVVGGTLNIEGNASSAALKVAFGEVNISGGFVFGFTAFDRSTVNISGGVIEGNISSISSRALFGSTVNISGGTVGLFFEAFSGSTVNISGGTVRNFFQALPESTVNISGGTLGNGFRASSGTTVNISGGTIGNDFDVGFGGTVNLFGSSFSLNGVELTGLVPGEAFIITNRNVRLTGELADGSAIDFDLNTTTPTSADFFSPDATLTVTLVPAPLCADQDGDGAVIPSDFAAFVANFNTQNPLADVNQDGVVSPTDFSAWVGAFNQGANGPLCP